MLRGLRLQRAHVFLVQWHDSRVGCEKRRFRFPERPLQLPILVSSAVRLESNDSTKGPSKRLQHLLRHQSDFVERRWKVVEWCWTVGWANGFNKTYRVALVIGFRPQVFAHMQGRHFETTQWIARMFTTKFARSRCCGLAFTRPL